MLRLLIGANSNRRPYLERLAGALPEFGIECRLVGDEEYDGYPSRNVRSWISGGRRFARLVSDFKPDVIMVDRMRGFAFRAANSGIPMIMYMRGSYWKEMDWRKQTLMLLKRWALEKWESMANECFSKATMIMPICGHLEEVAKNRYPNVPMRILQNFVDTSEWFDVEPMKLKHPCVGLLQNAGIKDKVQEMLLLKRILPAFPDVTFYWAGGGEFAEIIREELDKFPNFEWLGSMEYPGKVREYLAGIDVYALISGNDMSPSSLLEAQLMQRISLATDIEGIPESIRDGQTGFLISQGDSDEWVRRIRYVLDSPDVARKMGAEGRRFVAENFGLDRRARELSEIVKSVAE